MQLRPSPALPGRAGDPVMLMSMDSCSACPTGPAKPALHAVGLGGQPMLQFRTELNQLMSRLPGSNEATSLAHELTQGHSLTSACAARRFAYTPARCDTAFIGKKQLLKALSLPAFAAARTP